VSGIDQWADSFLRDINGFRPHWRVNPPLGGGENGPAAVEALRVKGIDNRTHIPVVESTSISVATSMPTWCQFAGHELRDSPSTSVTGRQL